MADFSMIPGFFERVSKGGEEDGETGRHAIHEPLIKLCPVHSTWDVTTMCEDALLAHVMHVWVLTPNTPPLSMSGVRVVVTITT